MDASNTNKEAAKHNKNADDHVELIMDNLCRDEMTAMGLPLSFQSKGLPERTNFASGSSETKRR